MNDSVRRHATNNSRSRICNIQRAVALQRYALWRIQTRLRCGTIVAGRPGCAVARERCDGATRGYPEDLIAPRYIDVSRKIDGHRSAIETEIVGQCRERGEGSATGRLTANLEAGSSV